MRRPLLLALALVAAAPAPALASGEDVVRDCADDGKLSKRYSQKEYRDALRDLPTDVDEYTDCRDVIRDARLGNAGRGASGAGGGSTGGGGGTNDATAGAGGLGTDPLAGASPQEKAAVQRAASTGSAPVTIAGETITPGKLGLGGLSGSNDLPTPLIPVLALLAAGMLLVLVQLARGRLPIGRNR